MNLLSVDLCRSTRPLLTFPYLITLSLVGPSPPMIYSRPPTAPGHSIIGAVRCHQGVYRHIVPTTQSPFIIAVRVSPFHALIFPSTQNNRAGGLEQMEFIISVSTDRLSVEQGRALSAIGNVLSENWALCTAKWTLSVCFATLHSG